MSETPNTTTESKVAGPIKHLERIRDLDEQTSDGSLGSLARRALDELAALSEEGQGEVGHRLSREDGERLEEIIARLDRHARATSVTQPHTGRGWKADADFLRQLFQGILSGADYLVVTEHEATNERRYHHPACGAEFMVPLDDAPLPPERECDGCNQVLSVRLSQPPQDDVGRLREKLLSDEAVEAGCRRRYAIKRSEKRGLCLYDDLTEMQQACLRGEVRSDLNAALDVALAAPDVERLGGEETCKRCGGKEVLDGPGGLAPTGSGSRPCPDCRPGPAEKAGGGEEGSKPLRFSERALWNETDDQRVHEVLARLARMRAAAREGEELREAARELLDALDAAEKLAAGGEAQAANVNRVLTGAARKLAFALDANPPPPQEHSKEEADAFRELGKRLLGEEGVAAGHAVHRGTGAVRLGPTGVRRILAAAWDEATGHADFPLEPAPEHSKGGVEDGQCEAKRDDCDYLRCELAAGHDGRHRTSIGIESGVTSWEQSPQPNQGPDQPIASSSSSAQPCSPPGDETALGNAEVSDRTIAGPDGAKEAGAGRSEMEHLADEVVRFAHDKLHDPEATNPSAMHAATDAALAANPDQPKDCGGSGRVLSSIIDGEHKFRDCSGCNHPDCPNRDQPKGRQR